MSKPCSLRMRRFAGLRSFETPGDKGLFPGLKGTCNVLKSGGKNSSRGKSRRGPRCRMVWVFKGTSCLVTKRVMSRVWYYSCTTLLLVYASVAITTSNTPVPVRLGRPSTMHPDGVRRSSKSPNSVASERKAAVVSYDAFRSGDGFIEIPLRLNGLYPPSNVYPPSVTVLICHTRIHTM